MTETSDERLGGSRALLVGVTQYEDADGFGPLETAGNSLDTMYALLTDPSLGGWPRSQVTAVRDPLTQEELGRLIANHAKHTAGAFLFYYVGHGSIDVLNNLLHLTAVRTNAELPNVTGLPWPTVVANLHPLRSPARTKLAILDCCFADNHIDEAFAQGAATDWTYTLTATTRNETAHTPPPGSPHGSRTSFTDRLDSLIREGLPAHGPWLSLPELFPHLRDRLTRDGLPIPNQHNVEEAQQFPFTRNAARRPSVTVTAAVSPAAALISEPPQRPYAHLREPEALRRVPVWRLTGHTGAVHALAFVSGKHRQGTERHLLATAGADHTVRLWDPATHLLLSTLEGHRGSVLAVAFNDDGSLLASGSADETVRLWDVDARQSVGRPSTMHRDRVYALAFAKGGEFLASAGADQTVRFLDPATQRQTGKPLTAHEAWIRSIAFSPDGSILATASGDRTARLWDPKTGDQLGSPFTAHRAWVRSVAFTPDGTLVASAGDDQTVRFWDPASHRHVGAVLDTPGKIHAIAFSPDGSLLAVAGDQTLALWDPATRRQIGRSVAVGEAIHAVAFSPDGVLLATAGSRRLTLWDVANPSQLIPEEPDWR